MKKRKRKRNGIEAEAMKAAGGRNSFLQASEPLRPKTKPIALNLNSISALPDQLDATRFCSRPHFRTELESSKLPLVVVSSDSELRAN